jgi:two-component system phosphate regulon response regulator PhoB
MLDSVSTTSRSLQKTVLLVFQEPLIRDLIAANLRQAGYYPIATASPKDGRSLVAQVLPDAILIDLDHEREAVSELTAHAQQVSRDRKVPVLMLTGDINAACGLGRAACGADECIAKPFSPHELVLRVARMFATHKASGARGALRVGLLELDPARHTVTGQTPSGMQEIYLRRTEFKLLQHLMTHADRVLRRDQLSLAVWGPGSDVGARTVDQTVKRVRQGLGVVGLEEMVQTVRGVGYRLLPFR